MNKANILPMIVTLSLLFIDSVNCFTREKYTYTTYQDSISCTSEYRPYFPETLEEIQDVISGASANNISRIKAVGSQHTISDAICTKGLPVYLTKIQHFVYNPGNKTAFVGAGMELLTFLDNLNNFGRTIPSPPVYGGITIGGAMAIGVHGTGFKNPTLAENIVSVTLVDGLGNKRKVTEDDDEFYAVTVNLGLFGIVYEVEFATIPQYKLKINQYSANESLLWNITEILERANKYDHFQFWWFPTNHKLVVSEGIPVPLDTPGNCSTTVLPNIDNVKSRALSTAIDKFQASRTHVAMFQLQTYAMFGLYKVVPGMQPYFVKEDGKTSCMEDPVGLSYKMKLNKCNPCYWQGKGHVIRNADTAFMIPVEKLSDAFEALCKIFKARLVNFAMQGIWVRFVSPAKSLMAINQGEAPGNGWATIEYNQPIRRDVSEPRLGISAFQAMGRVLIDLGARPHWGKTGLYYTTPEIIRKAHSPEVIDNFLKFRDAYDPNNLFMNTFGERLKGVNNALKVQPDLSKACGLNEVCECQGNRDCGKQGLADYLCTDFSDCVSLKYPVCSPTIAEEVKEVFTDRVAIEALSYDENTIVDALTQYPELNDWFN